MKTSCCVSAVILHLSQLGRPSWYEGLFLRNPGHNSYEDNPEHRYQRKSSGIHLKKCHLSLALVQYNALYQCRPQQRLGQTCAYFLKQIGRFKVFVAGIINITGVPNDAFPPKYSGKTF